MSARTLRCIVSIIGALALVITWTLTTAAISAASTPGSKSYVAMGDSFSAGTGAGNTPLPGIGQTPEDIATYGDTFFGCNRSANAYPVQLATTHGYQLTNVTCSGATIENILVTGQSGEPAQITALSENTNLVTLTIGGNDIGFLGIIICVLTSECNEYSPAIMEANAALGTIGDELTAMLTAITTVAPNADVVMGGYPRLLPAPGQPIGEGCWGWLSAAEQQLIYELQLQLNETLRSAASSQGITFVNAMAPASPFERTDALSQSLDACAVSDQRLINELRSWYYPGLFHPNALGQDAYAELFTRAVA